MATMIPVDTESPQEKWGTYVGITFSILPAMISGGFMPDWNVLPTWAWATIATLGAALGGAIATQRRLRGAIAGGAMGLGMFAGTLAYVALRAALTGHSTFLKLELVIGGLVGAIPGMVLYMKWARPEPETSTSVRSE